MIDRGNFVRYVEDAFARLDDRPYLLSHPLTSILHAPVHADAPGMLRRILLEAIEELRPPKGTPPSSTLWRRWRCLTLRYVDGVPTKRIAQQLLTSERQARRDHEAGIQAVASVLWAIYGQPGEARRRANDLGVAERSIAPSPTDEAEHDDVDTEVACLSAHSPAHAIALVGPLDEALETVSPLVESRRAQVRVSLAADLSGVYVNPDVLRQVILCALTAALHVGQSPRIDVSAVDAGSAVE